MLEFIFLILISWCIVLLELLQGYCVDWEWCTWHFTLESIDRIFSRSVCLSCCFFSCQIGCGNYSWYFQYVLSLFEEMFEDTKEVIRNHSVTDNVMAKRKKDKHDRKYTTRKGFSNANPIKNWGWMYALRKGRQFLLHTWHPSCYSCYKPSDKSWMRKGQYHDYDKLNISVVICDTDSATDNRGLALSI